MLLRLISVRLAHNAAMKEFWYRTFQGPSFEKFTVYGNLRDGDNNNYLLGALPAGLLLPCGLTHLLRLVLLPARRPLSPTLAPLPVPLRTLPLAKHKKISTNHNKYRFVQELHSTGIIVR